MWRTYVADLSDLGGLDSAQAVCAQRKAKHMKKTRSVDSAQPQPPGWMSHADKKDNASASVNLSPERIMEGATVTAALFDQMRLQREQMHQIRDWGINE